MLDDEPTTEWPERMWARTLAPGQVARLHVLDVETGDDTVLLESSDRLFEAPAWHPDGRWLVVNADGVLFRVDSSAAAPTWDRIPSSGLPELNNDHLISPDGAFHLVSANDGHLYRLPFLGGRAQQLTEPKDEERGFRHFLHGVSPDGDVLAFVGVEKDGEDAWSIRAIRLLDLASGEERIVGDGFSPADGPEFSRDGGSVFFNSEIEASAPGHAQLYRFDLTSGSLAKLTDDERVNWFPHPSPDGERLVYLSFPPGTEGHPADLPVILRLIDLPGSTPRDIAHLPGGQGTINVGSWAPDSRRLAYIDYPIG